MSIRWRSSEAETGVAAGGEVIVVVAPGAGLGAFLVGYRSVGAKNRTLAWNGFVQWVAFGGEGVIRQNNREE